MILNAQIGHSYYLNVDSYFQKYQCKIKIHVSLIMTRICSLGEELVRLSIQVPRERFCWKPSSDLS